MPVIEVGNDERTAEGAAFLVALEIGNWRAGLRVVRFGVQDRVTREQEGRAVQPIGARLGDEADHAA